MSEPILKQSGQIAHGQIMAAPVIEAIGIRKTFRQGKLDVPVLKGIDIRVGVGETHAIVGASGAGKSTLMHLLGGLDHADEGDVKVMGQSIIGLSEKNWATCVIDILDSFINFTIYYQNSVHRKI